MTRKKIRRLPIGVDGEIIGMVTIRDITNNLKYSLGKSILGSKRNNCPRPNY